MIEQKIKPNEILIIEYEKDLRIIKKIFKSYKEQNEFILKNLINKTYSCWKEEFIK